MAAGQNPNTAYDLLAQHGKELVAEFGGSSCERIAQGFGTIPAPCVRVCLPDRIEILLIASEAYPGTPPIALATVAGHGTEQLPLEWDVTAPAATRLARAFARHFVPPGPYRRVFGPTAMLPLTCDPGKAKAAGWPGFFSGAELQAGRVGGSLFQRSQGILNQTLAERSVFVVGLGSGGSYVASQLARVGVGKVYLLDPETVEASNLARTTYTVADIGLNKAEVLTKQLLNINPAMEIVPHACELADLGADELKRIVLSCDLILPLTDDPKAQSVLNHFAYHGGKPALFASIYRGAQGGEVILSLPEATPCYQCSTAQRRAVGDQVDVEVDYGTQRLVGEIALGADIQHIDSATVKLALSLLLKDCPDASLGRFAMDAVGRSFSYLVMSTVPDYWIFPHIFGDTQGQYGYQSAWLSPTRDERCSVCGAMDARTNPADFPLRPLRRGS